MRVARDRVRRQADDREQLPHARSASRAGRELVGADRLADDAADRVPRVQRRVGILEDHLHPSPQRAQLALVEPRDLLAVEDDPAVDRLVEAEDRPPDGRLAAAGLADEAERLPAPDLERDVVDGADVADVAVEQDAALDREVDLQPVDLDERRAVRAHAWSRRARRCPEIGGDRVEAGDEVAGLDLDERWYLLPRLLDLEPAARLERARARRREHVARARRGSVSAARAGASRSRDRLEQPERVRDAAASRRAARRRRSP